METLLLLLSSGVIAAFVAQLYTRKNLKTSQYINVITSERIKWIQDVRNEFSVLLSSVIFYLLNSNKIINESSMVITQELIDLVTEEEIEAMTIEFNKNKIISDTIKDEFKTGLSKREIVEKSILLKMKLNPKEDAEIISILDDIINTFSIVSFDVSYQNIRYEVLVNECQNMFKREWDKVKDETGRIFLLPSDRICRQR